MKDADRALLYWLFFELEKKQRPKIEHIHHAAKNYGGSGLDPTLFLRVDGSNSMTGDLNLIGGAKVTGDAWIPASAVTAPAIKGANYVDHGISGAWQFADGQEEIINANIKIPSDADMTEDMQLCIGWSSPAQTKVCDWEVAYLLTKIDDNTAAGAQQTLQTNATCSGTANGLALTSFTVDNATQIEATDICFHIQVMRDGNDGADTLADSAHVHGVVLIYVRDKLGAPI